MRPGHLPKSGLRVDHSEAGVADSQTFAVVGGVLSRAHPPCRRPQQTRHTQDCADFRGAPTFKQELGDKEGLAHEVEQQRKRQRAWVERQAEGYRPKKRHRVSSHEWLVCIEQQLKESTDHGSWKYFTQPEQISDRHPMPETWPSLSIAGDMDAPQLCPISFLVRRMNTNVEFLNDPSHGAWRDVGRALSDTNLTAFMKLLMVAENIPHGPWAEDVRWKQALGAIDEHMKHFDEKTSELFRALSPAMMQEMNMDAMGGDNIEQELWRELQEGAVWSKKGCRVNWNRFMGAITATRRSLQVWHQKLFGYLLTCIELDMLKGRHIKAWHLSSAAAGSGDAPLRRVSAMEDKVLQNACSNQMVVGTLMLADGDNRQRALVVVSISSPTERWHQEQAHRLRNVRESELWQREQREGGYYKHLPETFQVMDDPAALRLLWPFPQVRQHAAQENTPRQGPWE